MDFNKFYKIQSSQFNKCVFEYFIKKYNLNVVHNYYYLNVNAIYIKNDCFVLHNEIINNHYSIKLDTNGYSLIKIIYKNIKIKHLKKNVFGICNLNNKIKNRLNMLSKTINANTDNRINTDNIIIIGRKYYNKSSCYNNPNSLNIPCFYFANRNLNNNKKVRQCTQEIKCTREILSINRRKFLYNLKNELLLNKIQDNNLYINNILKYSIFLDVEFVNDIYDNFKNFPISNNSSLLFMIGISNYKNEYINLTTKRLTLQEEYNIILEFLNYISLQITLFQHKIIIFHWSNADKYIIEKTIKRHDTLYKYYVDNIQNNIIYIDLLQIIKKTISLKSYSLKYVSEKLLNIKYSTECKNGLDAMCFIFNNDNLLNANNNDNLLNDKHIKKSLQDFSSTDDIIEYNKMDTTLLYKIVNKFTLH